MTKGLRNRTKTKLKNQSSEALISNSESPELCEFPSPIASPCQARNDVESMLNQGSPDGVPHIPRTDNGYGLNWHLSVSSIVLWFTPIRKNNRGISGVERLRTPVTGILIVGLQHH